MITHGILEELERALRRERTLEYARLDCWRKTIAALDPTEPVSGLTARQIMDKYNCTEPTANRIRKRGWAQVERKREGRL
jgi:hypothetical protein